MKASRGFLPLFAVTLLLAASLACSLSGTGTDAGVAATDQPASVPSETGSGITGPGPAAITPATASVPAAAPTIAPVIPTKIPVDLTTGLVAYYPFNGDVLDGSGNGRDGALAAPQFTADRAGTSNGALQFNGADTIVYVKDDDALSFAESFTFSLWVRGDETLTHQWLLLAKHGTGECRPAKPSWILRYNKDAGVFFTVYDQNAECGTHIGYASPIKLDDGQWHSLVITYDEPTQALKFYFDCAAVFEQTVALNIQNNDKYLTIGNQEVGPTSTNFAGLLDEVRLYDRAQPGEAVQALCGGE